MTLDELAFYQQRMAARGGSAAEIAALAADAVVWRNLQKRRRRARAVDALLLEAVERALLPSLASPVFESGFMVAPASSTTMPAGPPPVAYRTSAVKSAARAGIVASKALRPCASKVLGRLVERLNLDSGQCNPSLETLAGEAGYTERSVRRALEELEELGLVRRFVNAGRGHSNHFEVNLDAMAGIAARAAPQRKADSGKKRTLESAKPDGRVLQNRIRKQIFQRPRARPDPQQREMLMPMPSAEASQAGAERRVMDDIEQAVRRQPSFNVSGLTPAQWADVHAAERHRRGEGIVLIQRILDDRGETGPPRVAVDG